MHYTQDIAKHHKINAYERENLIHRESKVPIKHIDEEPVSRDEYRKVAAPMVGLQIKGQNAGYKDIPRLNRVKSEQNLNEKSIYSSKNYETLKQKYSKVYESPRSSSTKQFYPEKTLSPEPRQDFIETKPPIKFEKKLQPSTSAVSIDRMYQTEDPRKNSAQSKKSQDPVFHTPFKDFVEPTPNKQQFSSNRAKQQICEACSNRKIVHENARNQISCKHDSEKKDLEKYKQRLEKTSSMVNLHPALKYETTIRKNQNYEQMSVNLSNKTSVSGKAVLLNNFITDNFGVEHSRIREQQKEIEREKVRKEFLNKLLKRKYEEIEAKKDALYFWKKIKK